MEQSLFTVAEVADRLGLHVRTVRNYVRDGRLKAVRIGKQYRIARADLEAFTGQPAAPTARDATARQRHVGVSSVVEVDAISRDLADRVSTMLHTAIAHRREGDEQLHLETIYDKHRAALKVVVIGSLTTSARIFELISAVIEEPQS